MLACRTRTLPSLSCQVQTVPENPRWPRGCLLAPCESPNTSMPTCSLAVCRVQRQPLSRPAAMERRSFGFETTLASRSFGPRIRRLIAAGYECHLVFLWLPSAAFAVARVADRVRLGGHTVPEETIQPLPDFDHHVANVRQFSTSAAIGRFGSWKRDACSERWCSLATDPGGGRS